MKSPATLLAIIAFAGLAQSATAQTFETTGGRLSFQVSWNGSPWSNSIPAVDPTISNRVELRVVASYVGTRTDLFAMGEVLYQPVLSGVDNAGATKDEIGPWRNGGNTSNANGMLTDAEGASTSALADYGRVGFGHTATSATGFNTITSFRHSAGSDGAPPGEHIRMAGIFVSMWPRSLAGPVPPLDVVANDINATLRGISSQQQSQLFDPTNHIPGVGEHVIFRQAIILSPDHQPGDVLTLSTFRESARRVGSTTGTTEGDDRRYMTWQTNYTESGIGASGHRTGIEYVPGTFTIVPAPMVAPLLAFGCAARARRRRA